MSEASMRNYYFYKSAGICVSCGQEKAVAGQTKCRGCRSLANAWSKEYYANKLADMSADELAKFRKANSKAATANKRKLREERSAKGLCVYCGKRASVKGTKSCEFCRCKNNKRAVGWYRAHEAKKVVFDHEKP